MQFNPNAPQTFEVTCGTIRATDPCYKRDTWCVMTVPAKNGTWTGEVEINDDPRDPRVARLYARHSSVPGIDYGWEKLSDFDNKREVGVDSGQAGLFDDAKYPNGEGEYGDLTKFYGQCCHITCEAPGKFGAVQNLGVVSSSGYGDGGYDLYGIKDADGQCIALMIEFIGDDDDDDDPDEDISNEDEEDEIEA